MEKSKSETNLTVKSEFMDELNYVGAQSAKLLNLRTGETLEIEVGELIVIDSDWVHGYWTVV